MEPLERALAELQEQNFGSAIRTLEMLTARDPSSADAYKHLSQAYFRTGRKEEASEAAQRYAALRPTDPAGHYNSGVILSQLGQAEAAQRAFRAALSADPTYAKAREALEKLVPAAPPPAAAVPAATPAASPFAPPTPAAAPDAAPAAPAPSSWVGDPVAPTPAPDAAATGPVPRAPMPWQAKAAAAGTVVASAAILLWLFLPGGPANPGPKKTNPEPAPHALATPPPNQPNAAQPENTQTPQPTPNPNTQPNPQQTPAPTPQPSATAPGAAAPSGAIFTPDQARAVAQQMDAAETQEVQKQLSVVSDWLRKDKSCQDPEFWPILQTTLATQGMSMIPGGPSIGAAEVVGLITNASTNFEAADNLDRYSVNLKSVLPFNLTQQLVQALALATSADEAYRAAQQVLKQNNTTLSQQADATLRQAAQQAEQAAAQRTPQPGR